MGALAADCWPHRQEGSCGLEGQEEAPAASPHGVDEIFWRKGKCLTVVSDLELGEPIWAGPERKKEILDRFFAEELPPRRRRSVRAVCMDMWEPFILSVSEHLPRAVIVFDKFHVMKYVNAAVDETRREEFFRQKGALRAVMRGKRWLFLTRWKVSVRRKTVPEVARV